MENLLKALIKAKQGFKPIIKSKFNPYFKSKYADLDTILEAVESSLLENDLIIIQTVDTDEKGEYLKTTLYHSSGESLVSPRYNLGSYNDPQKQGGAITYARRYQLCALLSIVAEDDNDGNNLTANTTRKKTKASDLPFKTAHESIMWAAKVLGVSEEEASMILENTPPDESGKKSANFYKQVMQIRGE
jgi:hypothetical protein